MLRKYLTPFLLAICFSSLAVGQSLAPPLCGTDLLHQRSLQNETYRQRHDRFEETAHRFFLKKLKTPAEPENAAAPVVLPVVVHVVHQNGAENISDAQILTGIQQLNEAYANAGYYDQGSGTNTMIQFCLARRDPDGALTSGITRHFHALTDVVIESQDVSLKDLARWDPTRYINIWIVREICSAFAGCGVAGYAYFPSEHGSDIDGIVMEAEYLGASPGGTGVLAHEMGHYLGLYHTFQGGCTNNDCLLDGDRVCDTPPDNSTQWLPCNTAVNTCNTDTQSGFATDQNDMILNFMDYTPFDCFHDFTAGQSARMNFTVQGTRASLTKALSCNDPCPAPVVAAFTAGALTVTVGQTVSFTNNSQNAATYNWTAGGIPFSTAANPMYQFNTPGTYEVMLEAFSPDPGQCNSDKTTVVIEVTCPVVASFQLNTNTPVVGQTVVFTNTSQNATQYEWFIDGVSQGAALASHVFSQSGVYAVRLEAGNGFCEKTVFEYIAVRDSGSTVPGPCRSFQNTYGTDADERGLIATEMPGGGYLLGGNTTQGNNQDVLVVRTDASGEILWSRRYGSAGQAEAFFNLQARPDGGFFLSYTYGTPSDAAFAVCDANGNVQFARGITTTGGTQTDVFYDIIATSDGGYLAAGSFSPSDNTMWAAFFLKMDAAGATEWYRAWNAAGTDFVTSVRELPGGGYIASGYGTSASQGGPHDGVAYRLDAAGNLLWTNYYGTPSEGGFRDVALAPDGGFLFSAGLWNFNLPNMPEGGIVRTDANGNLLWTRLYRPSNNLDWEGAGLESSPDGQFLLAGRSRPNTGDTKAYLLKLDADGQLAWTRQYGGPAVESIFDVQALTSGALLWTGHSTSAGGGLSDFYVLKTDADGLAELCPETPHSTAVIPLQLVQTPAVLQEMAPPVLQARTLLSQSAAAAKTEICPPDCISDPPCENTWIKTFAAPGMQQGGNNIIRTADGNFLVSGFRNDSSLLLKMTPDGTPLWLRVFKFTPGSDERINQIIEDSEGYLVGCGMYGTASFTGFTFRYNPVADQVVWAHANPANPQTLYYSIQEKSPGGNFITFNSYHNSPAPGSADDAHWVEINRANGQFVGTPQGFSFGSSEGVLELQKRSGNWYTAGRYTYGAAFEGMRMGLSCFDATGSEIWSRMLLFDANATARNYATDFTFDGADMVTIAFGDFNGIASTTSSIAVCKTGPSGNILWAKKYTLPLAQAFAKSILTLSDGYLVLVSEVSAGPSPSLCLFKTDKNGGLLWARRFPDYYALRGEKLMTIGADYLYFTAQRVSDGSLAVGKLNLQNGRVGGACPVPVDAAVQVADLPSVSNPVVLTRYPSPIQQSPRGVTPLPRPALFQDACFQPCNTEICNNGLDDDGDGLFDCLDSDCDCHTCDGAETNIWYFGREAGLRFSETPPTVLTDGKTFVHEASAVRCDPLGQLIFYTDSRTVFQRNHLPMPNGSGLFGHTSSSQTLIVPHPGNAARFYVFTPDSYDNGPQHGLSYSLVDMTLNNGFGDVAAGQKNLPLTPASELVEQISAVRHCNGADYWVLHHLKTTNAFLAYLVDQNGLNVNPVQSNTGAGGPAPDGNYDVIGQMKISPDGLHLARALYHTSAVEVFDFDAATGAVSNPRLLQAPALVNPYGVEFSPTGRYLYVTGLSNPSGLFQFDLLAGDAAAVAASATRLASFPGIYHYGQLQSAADGKIYTTNSGPGVFTTKLGVVHRPDSAGAASLYQENGQLLTGTPGVNLGLPNFVVSHFWKPAVFFKDKNRTDTICQFPQIQTFELEKLPCGVQSVDWKINGSATVLSQTKQSVTLRFDQAGEIQIVAAGIAECETATDSLRLTVLAVPPPPLDLGPDRVMCEHAVTPLDAGPGFKQYRWQDGTTERTFTAPGPGKYWVDVWDACGEKQSDTLVVTLLPATDLDLADQSIPCATGSVSYQLPVPFTSWQWSPADHLSCDKCATVTLSSPAAGATYTVVAKTADGCFAADTVTVQVSNDTVLQTVTLQTCQGQAVLWNGQNLAPGGPYVFTYAAANGCDSTLVVSVLENDTALQDITLQTCAGTPVLWDGQALAAGGPYVFQYTSAQGCDSTWVVSVVEKDTLVQAIQLHTCPGVPVFWDGQSLAAGGPYVFAYTAANGCDSTVLVSVLENDTVLRAVQLYTCPGQSVLWNGQTLAVGGPYEFAYTGSNGCDSTVLVSVLEKDIVLQSVQLHTCPGEPALWNGQPLAAGGPYVFAYTGANGCDSVLVVSVLENDSFLQAVQLYTCPGEPAFWNGQPLAAGGPYVFEYTTANGCDSTLVVSVLEKDTVPQAVQLLTCPGEPALWNGQSLAAGGPYVFAYTTASGCDSTVLVSVVENDTVLQAVQLRTCPGEPAVWNGQNLTPGGPYIFSYTGANGCDSTEVVTVSLASPLFLELGAEITLNLGATVQLKPLVNGPLPLQYAWQPPDHLSCDDCPKPYVQPLANTWYALKVTDGAGCTAWDSIFLRVNPQCDIYLPNAFQPNDDGHNDWFFPSAAACVRSVRLLRVYGRWGELVFERRDFDPNAEALGWDGRFRGRDFPPDVLVWYAEFELVDGRVEIRKGDVTLVR